MATMTTTYNNKPKRASVRDFFDKHKIPYCLVRHNFYEENGEKKKKLDKNSLPNPDWVKNSYEMMMAINDFNQRSGDTTLMAYLTNSKFGVLDADNTEGMNYITENYGSDNFTLSISREMPHKYFIKDKDDPGVSCTGWKPGLDLCYGIIFEKIDGEICYYNEDTLNVFMDYPKPEPVITPASVMRLDAKDRTFDPTILDLINKKYFGKDSYSDWSRIMWGIIYCWGEMEGRELCLKYSAHEDYTDQQTQEGVDIIINNYDVSRGRKPVSFGTLSHYAKESDEAAYKKWKQDNYNKNLPRNFRDLALRILTAELKDKIIRCDDDIYYRKNNAAINFIQGEKKIKRLLYKLIGIFPDKFKWLKVNEEKETEEEKELITIKDTDDVIKYILMLAPQNDNFMIDMIEENKNKIWFNDGYWNVSQEKFIYRTDETTCIFINREIYNKSNPTLREEIKNKILLKLFNNREDLVKFYLYTLKLALSGIISIKQFYEITGARDCGKSVLVKVLQLCFGDYVANLSINNFYKKKGDSETRDLGFLLQFPFARLFILNENDPSKQLNGSIIKSLCSGGDAIRVRALHQEETLIVPHGTLYMYANNSLNIEPLDTNDKKVSFMLNNKFVSQSYLNDNNIIKHNNVQYYLRDDKIDDYIKQREVIDEFTLMVLEAEECEYPDDLIEDDKEYTENLDLMILNDFAYNHGSTMSHYKIAKYIKEKNLLLQPKELRHLIKGLFNGVLEISKYRKFSLVNIIRVDDDEVEEEG